MASPVELRHRTSYCYEKAISLGPQVIQLRPAPHCRTPIESYTLQVTPPDHVLNWVFDSLANHVAQVSFPEKTAEFTVEVKLVADLTPINPFAFLLDPGFESFPFQYTDELAQNLALYLSAERAGPKLQSFLAGISTSPQNTVSFVGNVNSRLQSTVGYVTRMEHGVQSCEQTLSLGTGSCRDSAWLLVQVFRHLGLAARFVSGYLIQLATEDAAGMGSGEVAAPATESFVAAGAGPGIQIETTGLSPLGPRRDSADLHAWAEVYLPGAGWIGLDATSGLFTAEQHIPLACTPTPSQAAPIWGTVEPAQVDFSYSFTISRLNDAPTVAKPFSDEEWDRVRQVAHAVDRDLRAQDVRLTMGGEPTFVGIDEPESPQWNLDALGPIKRTRGLALIRRLRAATAPGGLLHFGQGKWYPGEPLPRWAFHCISRVDGVPVWENADLIAREESESHFTTADSLTFLQALTRRLQVSDENILPAFDPDSAAGAAAPPEASPGPDGAAHSSQEGTQLPAIEPVGYILPLRRRQPEGRLAWSSQLWFARPGRLILFPGDSPIGYRITPEAVPFVAPDDLVHELEAPATQPAVAQAGAAVPSPAQAGAAVPSPAQAGQEPPSEPPLAKLPRRKLRRPELFAVTPTPDPLPPLSRTAETATELVRPALCVQAVQGQLHVFLPYTPVVADYLDLVAAVEDTCQHLSMPIWLEGYTPPRDPRLRFFGLTPDPGVLEVNLPPTATWDELEQVNATLHEQALGDRLIAGKFAYDGSHLSTGGGSHIVVGAERVLESPVLRRPDLLRSMLTFWQRHPSLSFLFSGMYVGPTSQHPRVDEARNDALYELEVAFSQLKAGPCPPNILDGLFRNILVDATGNTHRAEFCIDKMFPPEGQGLRLGLLELRAFEMPPHYRMGLVEMLLVRALIDIFWKRPLVQDLVRWETALHDRFMLPHFVQANFREVLNFLRSAGFAFQEVWFQAQTEFRFPRIGSLATGGVELELRQALEPWNVLAEEANSAGMGRSVDSSLERMQVKVTGMAADSPWVVACNGRRVPLTPTGVPGEAIAGIRYRARRLSAALHPTIPVHTPLVFDLIDTGRLERNGLDSSAAKVLARCTYYAGPPDGAVPTTRPRDAEEARERRLQRFQISPAPAESVPTPPKEINPVFPMTLDLRFPPPPAPAPAAGGVAPAEPAA